GGEEPDEREQSDGVLTGHGTILLAEDNREVRALVRNVLRRAGYEVLSAADGEEAFRLGTEYPGPLDLLLTDLVMPGLRGEELYRRLSERRPGLRVLLMSGYPADDVVKGEIESGAVPFLAKPFTRDQLLRKVREVIESPREP
ncbi:MAG TPA: response regulator, partial [Thermoleophilia bacterium]|nr:response regulator [Thermoleophilia bacterium]